MTKLNRTVVLVSIIIPIYNISKYLRGCLDSCAEQTHCDIEVICVDDGSTDGSGEIADEYAIRDNRFRVIHKANGGLPSARSAGINVAEGDYIFHLDGDDDIPNDAIELLVEVAEKENADLVIGDYLSFDMNHRWYNRDSRLVGCISGVDYLHFILKEGLFNIWGKLIRRSLYIENQILIPENIYMGEDLVQMIQLAYYSKKVSTCKHEVYRYYVRPSSMSIAMPNAVGILTDRSIYAVDFIARFIMPRCDKTINQSLSRYVKNFIITYFRSPHGVEMRRDELIGLCKIAFAEKSVGIPTFSDIVIMIALRNLALAKKIVQTKYNIFKTR